MRTVVQLCFFIFLPYVTFAQQKKVENLSQFHVSLGYAPVLQYTPTSLDYSANEMTRLSIGTSYLKGYLKANIQFAKMVTLTANYPNCIMLDNSLAYQYHAKMYKNFSLFFGGQLGFNTVRFEYATAGNTNQTTETETSTGIELGLQQKLSNNLAITCSYKWMKIYATPRNNLSLVDIGMVYFFKPSPKLKSWLE